MFEKDGINAVSVLLHSHLAGRKLKLRHIRGKKELTPLAEVSFETKKIVAHVIKFVQAHRQYMSYNRFCGWHYPSHKIFIVRCVGSTKH